MSPSLGSPAVWRRHARTSCSQSPAMTLRQLTTSSVTGRELLFVLRTKGCMSEPNGTDNRSNSPRPLPDLLAKAWRRVANEIITLGQNGGSVCHRAK